MIVAVVLDIATVGVILSSMLSRQRPRIRLADSTSVSRYYRHSWDTPVCWITTKYQKVSLSTVTVRKGYSTRS